MTWYLAVLKRYGGFDDRAHRTEFWMFMLWGAVVSIALVILDAVIGTENEYGGLLSGIYAIATIVPSLAVGARRLHDIGRSGWWQLIGLIPLIGLIVLIVWWARDGEAARNEWGGNPWEGAQPA